MPEEVELCPIELPGRGTRLGEPAIPDMNSLVRPMAEALEPLLDLPYAVLGCSMGALVGFEFSRTLRGSWGREPETLLAVSQNAPSAPLGRLPARMMSDEELRASLRRFGGMPVEVLDNPRMMRLFLPVLRADYSVVDTYEYEAKEPLRCPIHLFAGTDDPSVGDEGLEGWRRETYSGTMLNSFDGGHFFFQNDEPGFLAVVSSRLQELL